MFAMTIDFDQGPQPDSLIEKRLLSTPPGAVLASFLERIDRADLSDTELVAMLQARARLVAHDQAQLLADMVAVGDAVAGAVGSRDHEFEADEIRAALCLTRRTAEDQLALAQAIVERYPHLWRTLNEGSLDLARVKVFVDAVLNLKAEAATRVIEDVLAVAAEMTSGELRAHLAKLIISVDPDGAHARYQEGLKSRRVWAGPGPDGTASLLGLGLAADRVVEAMRRIHALAKEQRTEDDDRTADQRRADIFLDLLCGDPLGSANGAGLIDLRVDLTTLAGLDENPGEIPGWGPVISDVARRVAERGHRARWQATVIGEQGEVIWTGATRRRPDTAMRRFVKAHAVTCVFPGCRMPAEHSDLDHHQPWAEGGATDPTNLGPLCRHDHRLKHEGGWNLQRVGFGRWRWLSPLGRIYEVGPEPP